MRRLVVAVASALLLGGALFIPQVRGQVRAWVRPEPPAEITPLALVLPMNEPAHVDQVVLQATTPTPTLPRSTPTTRTTGTARTSTRPTAPVPTAAPTAVVVNGRTYEAYIPAATKKSQAYKYSCEFDAAWVILQTYDFNVSVDDLIAVVGVDRSVEPYIEQTKNGFVIHGGDITTAFSGNYKTNFLARSSAPAIRKAFEHYGLRASFVRDRAGIERALRAGQLVWIKTTVDFKAWRPAMWLMPDGRTQRTVLGNDHAIVVIGFNRDSVVLRDVLGPTSSNRKRPYEYEVRWETFLRAWEAQAFDGLAVAPPRR